MKQELLEHLIRQCVREVLTQVREQDETHSDMAPPADGQGTGDEPAVPNPEEKPEERPQEPETPPAPELKGVIFVNPKDQAKLQKIDIRSKDPASIERELHNLGARMAGSRVKVSLSAARMVKDVISNPNTSLYLYLGKYDPNSEETFLMADKSLQVAKDSSVSPAELTGTSASSMSQEFNPLTAQPGEFAKQMTSTGKTPVHGVDEVLKKVIKKMVNEILDCKKTVNESTEAYAVFNKPVNMNDIESLGVSPEGVEIYPPSVNSPNEIRFRSVYGKKYIISAMQSIIGGLKSKGYRTKNISWSY